MMENKKFLRHLLTYLLVIVFVNLWTFGIDMLARVPHAHGEMFTITAVQEAGSFNWVKGFSQDKEVYARVSTEVQVDDQLMLYTSDESNYWDVSEDLVFCDGVLNKPSGVIALGSRLASFIHSMQLGLNILSSIAFWAGLIFLLVERRTQRKTC